MAALSRIGRSTRSDLSPGEASIGAAQPPRAQVAAPVLALVGPTAVGKSTLALTLARLIGAFETPPERVRSDEKRCATTTLAHFESTARPLEIVNADAMAVYRGMDIGTAKPDSRQRRSAPHYMLDRWPVSHAASVVEYRDAARRSIVEIAARSHQAALVGGSGLYVSAVLDDLHFPGTDSAVRERYAAMLAEQGPQALHDLLGSRDPAAASAIEPANGRRLVRALEVVELTGSFQARLPNPPPEAMPAIRVGLRAPWPWLDERITVRTEQMWDQGLLDEVAALLREGLRDSPTAARAVGYQEAIAVHDGRLSRREAIEGTIIRTRRLARRQMRWFSRDPRVNWLNVVDGDDVRPAEDLAREALSHLVGSRNGAADSSAPTVEQ